MKMILMGTGTSHGMPVIGCTCHGCTSPHKKDKRLRCSAYVVQSGNSKTDRDGKAYGTTNILIDAGPEFRIQALEYHLARLDAVLLTHSHADHLHGLDDLRIFSHTKSQMHCSGDTPQSQVCYPATEGNGLPVYANTNTIEDVVFRFSYIFSPTKEGGGKPKLDMQDVSKYNGQNPLSVGTVEIIPVPMMHGTMATSGWLLSCTGKDGNKHSMAYLTDCNSISDEAIERITQNCGILDHLVIDGLRARPHTTHFSFDESLACADKIAARYTWLTHICHDMRHTEIQKYVNEHIAAYPHLAETVKLGGSAGPAYDGLILKAGE
jgi:phosphoribosyl 1,2-cyclic phosphate phosphodiesterase